MQKYVHVKVLGKITLPDPKYFCVRRVGVMVRDGEESYKDVIETFRAIKNGPIREIDGLKMANYAETQLGFLRYCKNAGEISPTIVDLIEKRWGAENLTDTDKVGLFVTSLTEGVD